MVSPRTPVSAPKASTAAGMSAVPTELPTKPLTGENTELVDTRVLQVIYAIEPNQPTVYVGQQLDVFIETGKPSGTTGQQPVALAAARR